MSGTGILNLLVAYPYTSPEVVRSIGKLGNRCRWFLDSGAFTAWKAKKPILLDDYCRFLDGLPVQPWRYFALDVIGDPEGTRRNYEVMLSRGYRPVPVFTRGEDPAALDEYYRTSDVVGLGGVAGADRSAYAWVRWIMQHVAGRKVHILGFTNMDWVKFLRPYSVDSSTWEQAARFGRMDVYLGHGRFETPTRNQVMSGGLKPAVLARIAQMGFDPYGLRSPAAWTGGRSLSCSVAAASWIAASQEVERRLGTMLFLAAATGPRVEMLIDAFENHSAASAA